MKKRKERAGKDRDVEGTRGEKRTREDERKRGERKARWWQNSRERWKVRPPPPPPLIPLFRRHGNAARAVCACTRFRFSGATSFARVALSNERNHIDGIGTRARAATRRARCAAIQGAELTTKRSNTPGVTDAAGRSPMRTRAFASASFRQVFARCVLYSVAVIWAQPRVRKHFPGEGDI